MLVCRRYGISHSHFMGGPRRWNQLDRDKATALERVMREQCPRCGTLAEDWVDLETGIPLERPTLAAVSRHCYGCDNIEAVESQIPKKVRGAYVALIPFDDLEFENKAVLTPTDLLENEIKVVP